MQIREGRSDTATRELTPQERSSLLQVVKSPGWPVVLMMMERECIQQETNLLNVAPEDEKKVIAEHREAQAFWRFFVRIQKNIGHQVAELLGEQTGPNIKPTAEEREIASVVEPWEGSQEQQ